MKQIITFLFVGLFGLSLSAQDKIAKIEFEKAAFRKDIGFDVL